MWLILVRHALQNMDPSLPDSLRPLSEEGKAKLHAMRENLWKSGYHPSVIYTSPATRAVETANGINEKFHCPIYIEDALMSSQEDRLFDILKESSHAAVCFVGHAPFLTEFARELVQNTEIPEIKRAAALVMELSSDLTAVPLAYISAAGLTPL